MYFSWLVSVLPKDEGVLSAVKNVLYSWKQLGTILTESVA